MIGLALSLNRCINASDEARALAAIRRAGGTVLRAGLIRNYFDSAGTTAATVDNPVGLVQDSVGSNHATQATVGSKPTLRRDANGRYYWQFDPTAPGDFLQTSITTGNEGWVCAGFKTFAVGAQAMLSSGATSAAVAGAMLRIDSSNSPQILVGNGTTREFVSDFSVSVPIGTPFVIEGGWNASSMFCAVNGSAGASLAKTVNCTTTNTFNVGAAAGGVNAANGAMPVTIICPTLPPPADRALIRKWVGSLQGQTL